MINPIHNPNCDGDHCKKTVGEVRKLPAGHGSNMLLCRDCLNHELEWRRERNYSLDEIARYDLTPWEYLETVYKPSVYEEIVATGAKSKDHLSVVDYR